MSTQPKSFADRIMAGIGGWLMGHMELIFRIARNTVPILVVNFKGKRFALITRFDDVAEVLTHPNVFDVIYAPKLNLLMDGGNIFLGMRDTPDATRDRSSMRLAAPRGEALTRIRPEVEAMAEAAMAKAAPAGRVDLAMELTQDLTTRFFGGYFGTPADDITAFSDDARLLFQFMFADMSNDPVLEAKVRPVAAAMRARVEKCIADRKGDRGKHDDVLERCLELQDIGTPGMDDDGIRNNMIGFIVGGLPQPPMIIPQLFDVLLDRPTELAGAQAAALADDDDLVSRYVFEALRYYPLTPGLFRDCSADYEIAGGTMRSRIIPAGTRVMAATRSAMFDGRRVPTPKKFRLDRPDFTYMNFGWGLHQCFGLYINQQMTPAICKAVLKRPGLRRAAGPEGKLRLEGIFAMNLTVEFDG